MGHMGLWDCAQIYILYLLAVAVHEAGHMLAAWGLGYPWRGVIIGPLKVSRQHGPVRVSYSQKPLAGRALVAPRPRDTRTRQALFICGGPVASLLLGIGSFLVLQHLTPDQQRDAWQVSATVVISAYIFGASVIPYTHKGFRDDAALLVQLWRDKEKWADHYSRWADYDAKMEQWKKAHGAEYEMEEGSRRGVRPVSGTDGGLRVRTGREESARLGEGRRAGGPAPGRPDQ